MAQQRGLRLVTWEQFRRKKLEPNTDGGALLASASDPVADGGPEGNTAPRVLPLLERGENGWRVLDQVMPSASSPVPTTERGLVPGADRFRHVCFDQPFADTLRAVCIGAAEDLPVALEGDTSASKTTAVLYLAHLLEQPVLRFNLNGQTDTGELVGRYVPGSVTDALDVEELRRHAALLRSESRELLELAGAENRGLTPLEAMLLAAREGLPAVGWRFQEGCLPRAARRGLWLLLDEMNLAEPQVLERLNPVLEQPRTLVLSQEIANQASETFHVLKGDLVRAKMEHPPPGQPGLQIVDGRAASRAPTLCATCGSLSRLTPVGAVWRPLTQMPPSISINTRACKWAKSALQRRSVWKRYSLSRGGPSMALQSIRKRSSRREGECGAR